MNSLFEKLGVKAELETNDSSMDQDVDMNEPTTEETKEVSQEADLEDVKESVKESVEETETNNKEKATDNKESEIDKEEDFIISTIGEQEELPSDNLLQQLKAHGIEVESLDELKKPKAISEELLAIQNFIDATGKSPKDYYEIFRDVDSIGEDELIRDYHKELGTTPKMLDLRMEELSILEQDPDFPDEEIEKHNRRAEALREAELLKAKKYFKEQQDKFSLPEQPTEEELLKQREEQILAAKQMAERVSTNLPPIEFSVGQKKFRMVHGKMSKELVKEFIENPQKHFVEPYVDAQGKFKSPEKEIKYYENGLWFNEKSREKMLEIRDKQIWDAAIESQSKDRRNVTLDQKQSTKPSDRPTGLDAWNKIRYKR